MDFAALCKHTLTFSSSLFDVTSDVINSLNFLGYYKNSTQISSLLGNVTKESNHSFQNSNYSIVSNSTFQSDMIENDEVHQLWGIIGMAFIFLPGFIGGSGFVTAYFYFAIHERKCKYFGISLLLLLMSLMFPFAFLLGQIAAICMVLFKKEIDTKLQLKLTGVTNLEASVESIGQLCLQLFTILYGYPSGLIQKITIATSFIQIARCAILNDIEAKLEILEFENLTFVESLWETLQRLPAYVSTIIFKVACLVLCMACLRIYSSLPMILLIFELVLITWMRVRKNTGWDNGEKSIAAFYLVFSNVGVVNAYTFLGAFNKKDEEEEEYIINFVRRSSIIAFLHHSTVLVAIMVLGWNYPDTFEHWSSPSFLLSPSNQLFYSVFTVVLLIGVYSLTVILYRAHKISTVEQK